MSRSLKKLNNLNGLNSGSSWIFIIMLSYRIFRLASGISSVLYSSENFGCVRYCSNLEDILCEWWVKCEGKRWRLRGKHPQLGPRDHQPQLGNLSVRQEGELFLSRRRHFGQMTGTCIGSQQSGHIRGHKLRGKTFLWTISVFSVCAQLPMTLFFEVVVLLHGWPKCKEYDAGLSRQKE